MSSFSQIWIVCLTCQYLHDIDKFEASSAKDLLGNGAKDLLATISE
jgi:hypothetical protein